MKKGNWWSFILLVTATYIGITAQDLAYGLHAASGLLDPIHYLMILTILSIGLFAFSVIRLVVIRWKGSMEEKRFSIWMTVSIIIGGAVSVWSGFVLLMWMG
ncbi:hypothetical protein Q0N12_11605 [Rossellomorea marisflavi]|uniref:hypothetical protein n=1 Tax=Rossellomorea marisflavi TaxID=189381 RepID=UPI003459CF71